MKNYRLKIWKGCNIFDFCRIYSYMTFIRGMYMKKLTVKALLRIRALFLKYRHSAFMLAVLITSLVLILFSLYAGISMSIRAVTSTDMLFRQSFFLLRDEEDFTRRAMYKSVYLDTQKYRPPSLLASDTQEDAHSDFLTSYIGDRPLADEYYEKWLASNGEDAPSTETLYYYDVSAVPPGEMPIIPMDISRSEGGEVALLNQTSFDVDTDIYVNASYTPPPPSESGPLILILHTHGTEAFSEEGAVSYSGGESQRSTDCEKNIVAVGREMKEEFERAGLGVVHCTELFDAESYSDAYDLAAQAIREYLALYPSIKYVFDVHRDSLLTSDGAKIRPVTLVDGAPAAQVMSVVGTDEAGSGHTGWRENFTLAVKLQLLLLEQYKNIARPINLRSASFNEQYTSGSLLLEIGSCGNTLKEAKLAGRCVARCLARIILAG